MFLELFFPEVYLQIGFIQKLQKKYSVENKKNNKINSQFILKIVLRKIL